MKRIILFWTALLVLCAHNCTPDIVPEQQLSLAKSDEASNLEFTLMQEHFVTISQIIHNLVIDTNEDCISGYRFIDVHIAWLLFADGKTTNPKPYEICYNVLYNNTLCYSSPQELIGKTFTYDDGFKIAQNSIKCEINTESFDNIFFTIDNTKIEFSYPELKSCFLQPTTLSLNELIGNTLKGTINIAFYNDENKILDSLELPIELKLYN